MNTKVKLSLLYPGFSKILLSIVLHTDTSLLKQSLLSENQSMMVKKVGHTFSYTKKIHTSGLFGGVFSRNLR